MGAGNARAQSEVQTQQQAPLPRVAVLATGGTIAGTAATETQTTGYKPGELTADALLKSVPSLGKVAQVSGEQVSNVGSDNITNAILLKLSKRVNELLAQPDIAGVVITHGTDTLEETAFEPVVASRVFDSIVLLTNGIRRFAQKCVKGIQADVERNEKHLLESMAVATALVPKLGYARVSKLARQSVAEGRSLVTILDESGLLSSDATLAAIRKASYPVFDA